MNRALFALYVTDIIFFGDIEHIKAQIVSQFGLIKLLKKYIDKVIVMKAYFAENILMPYYLESNNNY